MSAWLCESGTLSLVVDVIKSSSFSRYYDVCGEFSDLSEDVLMDLLSSINVTNLCYLYDSFPSVEERVILDGLEYKCLDVSNEQRYLSVCSFIYQSCDCDVNRSGKLFGLLVRWRDDYGKVYDDCTDGCVWDIDNPL